MTRIVGTLAVIWALKVVGIASATSVVVLLLASAFIHTALWLVSRRNYDPVLLDLKIPPSPARVPAPPQHDPDASTVLEGERPLAGRPARALNPPFPSAETRTSSGVG